MSTSVTPSPAPTTTRTSRQLDVGEALAQVGLGDHRLVPRIRRGSGRTLPQEGLEAGLGPVGGTVIHHAHQRPDQAQDHRRGHHQAADEQQAVVGIALVAGRLGSQRHRFGRGVHEPGAGSTTSLGLVQTKTIGDPQTVHRGLSTGMRPMTTAATKQTRARTSRPT